MAYQGRCDICVVFTMTWAQHSWIETNVDKFAILSHTTFKLDKQALRSYLKLTCEYEPNILPKIQIQIKIQKLERQRIMVKTIWRSDHPWSAIFCVIVNYATGETHPCQFYTNRKGINRIISDYNVRQGLTTRWTLVVKILSYEKLLTQNFQTINSNYISFIPTFHFFFKQDAFWIELNILANLFIP